MVVIVPEREMCFRHIYILLNIMIISLQIVQEYNNLSAMNMT